jgi:AcrR family transcriptional regulator
MSKMPPRELILAKAGELFHLRGYGAVTIEEIIAATGLSRAAFHQNFSSKEKVGCAWLERLTKGMSIMHQSFLDKPGDRDRRLRKYFYSMRSWLEANGYRSCQFANTAASISPDDEDLIHLIDQYKRAQHKFFVELAKTLVEESDAQRIGTAIFLLYSGAMTEAQNLKATWPFDDALAAAEDLCGVSR